MNEYQSVNCYCPECEREISIGDDLVELQKLMTVTAHNHVIISLKYCHRECWPSWRFKKERD